MTLKQDIIDARHATYAQQIEVLRRTLMANQELWHVLDILPDGCWVGAGAVMQNVWNCLDDRPWNEGLKDIDILYFDEEDLSSDAEQTRACELQAIYDSNPLTGHTRFELDVVNVARVHVWYEQIFGKRIKPYTSVAHSVSSWPTLCSMIAVNREKEEFNIIAPVGLYDMYCGLVRPNKLLITKDIYIEKVTRWKHVWPWITVLDWDADTSDLFCSV